MLSVWCVVPELLPLMNTFLFMAFAATLFHSKSSQAYEGRLSTSFKTEMLEAQVVMDGWIMLHIFLQQ